MSINHLIEKIAEMQSPIVAGLDPKLDYIPEFILEKSFSQYGKNLDGAADALFEFNKGLIDSLYDIVPAVKPQSAYYEMYGWQGVRALKRTIDYAREKSMYVIADIKRNDIGSTAESYAKAYLGETGIGGENITAFGSDSATVNGYLGTDGIEPFLKQCKKGKSIFVLVKTSNQSSGELQDLPCRDKTVYGVMGDMVRHWGEGLIGKYGYSEVGAVVGATYPAQQQELRKSMPETFFLVPGYGAQGAKASDIVHAFDKRGLGAIVNSSRGIMCAWQKGCDGKDYGIAARNEAINMKNELLSVIGKISI